MRISNCTHNEKQYCNRARMNATKDLHVHNYFARRSELALAVEPLFELSGVQRTPNS